MIPFKRLRQAALVALAWLAFAGWWVGVNPCFAAGEANAPWSNFYVTHGGADPNLMEVYVGGKRAADANGGVVYKCLHTSSQAGNLTVLVDAATPAWPGVQVGDNLVFDIATNRQFRRVVAIDANTGTGGPFLIVSSAVASVADCVTNVEGYFGDLHWAAGTITLGLDFIDPNNGPPAINVIRRSNPYNATCYVNTTAGTANLPYRVRGVTSTAGDIDWTCDPNMAVFKPRLLVQWGGTYDANYGGPVLQFDGSSQPHGFGVGQKVYLKEANQPQPWKGYDAKTVQISHVLDGNQVAFADGNTATWASAGWDANGARAFVNPYANSVGQNVVNVNKSYWQFENLECSPPDSNNAYTGMTIGQSYTTVRNFRSNGGFIGITTTTAVGNTWLQRICVTNTTCTINTFFGAIAFYGTSNNNVLIDAIINRSMGYGLLLNGTNNYIHRVRVIGCADGIVGTINQTGNVISQCEVVDNALHGLDFQTYNVVGMTVQDNIVAHNGMSFPAAGGTTGNTGFMVCTIADANGPIQLPSGQWVAGISTIWTAGTPVYLTGVADANYNNKLYFLKATAGSNIFALYKTYAYAANSDANGKVGFGSGALAGGTLSAGQSISSVSSTRQQRFGVEDWNCFYGNAAQNTSNDANWQAGVQMQGGTDGNSLTGRSILMSSGPHDIVTAPYLDANSGYAGYIGRSGLFYRKLAGVTQVPRVPIDANFPIDYGNLGVNRGVDPNAILSGLPTVTGKAVMSPRSPFHP